MSSCALRNGTRATPLEPSRWRPRGLGRQPVIIAPPWSSASGGPFGAAEPARDSPQLPFDGRRRAVKRVPLHAGDLPTGRDAQVDKPPLTSVDGLGRGGTVRRTAGNRVGDEQVAFEEPSLIDGLPQDIARPPPKRLSFDSWGSSGRCSATRRCPISCGEKPCAKSSVRSTSMASRSSLSTPPQTRTRGCSGSWPSGNRG